ncbi:MAG: hypothetical protein JWO31_928 [Phycisphaerales bacterium]|nr:hypothetical protein [Phycisphaerales bacterium]
MTTINSTNYAVRMTALRVNSKCPVSGRQIPADVGPFAVFHNQAVLHPDAAAEVAPELAAVVAAVEGVPADVEALWFVTPRTSVYNTKCPVNGGPLADPKARPFDISGGNGKHLSVEGGEDVAPTLARALHRYFGTRPTPRTTETADAPAAVPQAVVRVGETIRDQRARLVREAAERRASAVDHLTGKFGAEGAELIVEAIEIWKGVA